MADPIYKSRAMLRVEARLKRPLEDYFAERYLTHTQEQIAAELDISGASVSRWMRDLGIETRFPNQRPPASVAS